MGGRTTADPGLRIVFGGVLLAATFLACSLLAAAEAHAAVRFAAPGGNETPGSQCLQTNPCSLFNAASRFATATRLEEGDEVIVLPGTYSGAAGELGRERRINPEARTSIHGLAGQPRPVIVVQGGNGTEAFDLDEPVVTLSRVEILAGDGSGPWFIRSPSSVIDGVVAISSTGDSCAARAGLVRNSVCLSTEGTSALEVLPPLSPGTVELRNVTAIATGPESRGIWARAFDPDEGEINLHGVGVLARGTEADIFAEALSSAPNFPGTGSTVTISLDHSDFATVSTDNDPGEGTATVPTPGSGANITAEPLLAADGYHQLPTSRTIDAGALDPADASLSGSTDIDGDARVVGSAPDIGADEWRPPAPPAPPAPPRPNTTLKRKPPRKTEARRATFTFASDQAGARFECKLDRKPFKPCRSPFKVKGLKRGRHTFQVRAASAGASDPTPVVFRWRVL